MNPKPVVAGSRPVVQPEATRPTLQQARAVIMDAAHAPQTLRKYRIYWRVFTEWCGRENRPSLPADADTIIDFLLVRLETGVKLSTLSSCLSAIRDKHLAAGLRNPVDIEVQGFMRNARRKLKQRVVGKNALTPGCLRNIVRALDAQKSGVAIRDKAMILTGFASGWRGGEIVGLALNEISFLDDRLCLELGASKMDQEAKKGRRVYIPEGHSPDTCPVAAMRAWLDLRGEWQGPLFCSVDRWGRVKRRAIQTDVLRLRIKKHLRSVGANAGLFGSHSLRAGMITAAVENGADALSIAQRTGHSDLSTVLRYVRPALGLRYDPLRGVL